MRLTAAPQFAAAAYHAGQIPLAGRVAQVWRAVLAGVSALTMLLLAAGEGHAQQSNAGTVDNAGGAGAPSHMSLDANAAAGDPFAAFVAGRRHLIVAANNGDLAERRKGLALIAQAADSGFAPAARFGGALFLEGRLVEPDPEQAIHWFIRAAKLGDVAAQLDLGDLFADGELMPIDLARSARWYQAALDNPAADYHLHKLYEVAYRLGEMYADGTALVQDGEKARALWQTVVDEVGYPPAYRALARAYAQGIGGPVDEKTAFRLYVAAATAYREAGIRFEIGPTSARREVAEILSIVQDLNARGKVIRKVKKEMDLIDKK